MAALPKLKQQLQVLGYASIAPDGTWSGPVDLSAYAKRAQPKYGRQKFTELEAQVGTCQITFNNADARFSPENGSSPYAAWLTLNTPVQVNMVVTVGNAAPVTYTLFSGYVKTWKANIGTGGKREATITLQDALGLMQNTLINFPALTNVTGDVAIRGLVNMAMVGIPPLSGFGSTTGGNYQAYALCSTVGGSTISNGDTITITFGNQSLTLTFTNSYPVTSLNQVYYSNVNGGFNGAVQAGQNLVNALNQGAGLNTLYGPITPISGIQAYQSWLTGVALTTGCQIVSMIPGTQPALAVTLVTGGSAFISAYPVGATWYDMPKGSSYDVGRVNLPLVGDKWDKGNTDALTAAKAVTDSENGLLYCKPDGTVVWKNRDFQFTNLANGVTASMTGASVAIDQNEDGLDFDNWYATIVCQVQPPAQNTTGVIAKDTSIPMVPGNSTKTFHLPFVDPATGKPCGYSSLSLPLVAGTDWVANERKDGKGNDYATGIPGYVFLTYAVTASAIDIAIQNTATGPLYFTKLQVQGTTQVRNNPVTVTQSNGNASGKTLKQDLSLSDDAAYAESLAIYLLQRYGSPTAMIEELDFKDMPLIQPGNTTSVLSLAMTHLINFTDAQTGANQLLEIIGFTFDAAPAKCTTKALVRRADANTYWLLGDNTYGQLGTTTRLAI